LASCLHRGTLPTQGGTVNRKSLVRLSLSLLLLVVAIANAPSAEAGCENQRTRIIKFYAYVDTGNPNQYWCQVPVFSPPCPSCFSWQQIGEIIDSDCDGYSSWGDTTTCTDPGNIQSSSYICAVLCS
jgi:hypothetical protein